MPLSNHPFPLSLVSLQDRGGDCSYKVTHRKGYRHTCRWKECERNPATVPWVSCLGHSVLFIRTTMRGSTQYAMTMLMSKWLASLLQLKPQYTHEPLFPACQQSQSLHTPATAGELQSTMAPQTHNLIPWIETMATTQSHLYWSPQWPGHCHHGSHSLCLNQAPQKPIMPPSPPTLLNNQTQFCVLCQPPPRGVISCNKYTSPSSHKSQCSAPHCIVRGVYTSLLSPHLHLSDL